jgi:hypothetical protein
MAFSTSGYLGSSFCKSSLFSLTSKLRTVATIEAVRGMSIKIPISPKNEPGLSSAYVLSPSMLVTLTLPRTSQYIAFASSPSLMTS